MAVSRGTVYQGRGNELLAQGVGNMQQGARTLGINRTNEMNFNREQMQQMTPMDAGIEGLLWSNPELAEQYARTMGIQDEQLAPLKDRIESLRGLYNQFQQNPENADAKWAFESAMESFQNYMDPRQFTNWMAKLGYNLADQRNQVAPLPKITPLCPEELIRISTEKFPVRRE
jgi:hypothetical protein